MNRTEDYKIALELASCSRYEEARDKLRRILGHHPADVQCLVLLGKVEYYLRLFRSSRSRFETALTYDPGNMAAFFGLRFYEEKIRRRVFVVSLVGVLLLLLLAGGFYAFRVDSSLDGLDGKLGRLEQTAGQDRTAARASRELVLEKLNAVSRRLSALEDRTSELAGTVEETVDRASELTGEAGMLARAQGRVLTRLEDLSRTLNRELDDLRLLLEKTASPEQR